MKYVVKAYDSRTGYGYREHFFSDLDKAKEKRAELLATLPSYYFVSLSEE
jgi:hypothetical protein